MLSRSYADSGTPTSVEAGAGITSTATSCRGAKLLLVRPGCKDLLLEATLRPLEEHRGGEQGRILPRQGGDGAVQPLARRGVRRAAIPPDSTREERALRPLPKSGVRPRDGGQKPAPIPVWRK